MVLRVAVRVVIRLTARITVGLTVRVSLPSLRLPPLPPPPPVAVRRRRGEGRGDPGAVAGRRARMRRQWGRVGKQRRG